MIVKPDLLLFNRSRNSLGLKQVTQAELEVNSELLFRETRDAAIDYIIGNQGKLPSACFPELHTYKETYPIREDYSVFLIGTFHPISSILDLLTGVQLECLFKPSGRRIRKPKVPFYHGQRCTQWQLFDPGLIPSVINDDNRYDVRRGLITFLNEQRVNYLDVIDACQRSEYDADDSHLFNIRPNRAAFETLLSGRIDSPILIFNTSSAFGTKGLDFSPAGELRPQAKSFDIFLALALDMGCRVSFSVDRDNWISVRPENVVEVRQLMKGKLIFYMSLNSIVFTVVAGVSPSNAALNMKSNSCFQNYYRMTGIDDLRSFKAFVYQNAIRRDLRPLWLLNS